MSQRHRVFVSYHHANDEKDKETFNSLFGDAYDILVRGSVEIGDIDPTNKTETIRQIVRDTYLRDSSVTVVLVGIETWQRKHVDWEIYSSLRDTDANPRSGLLGILLPSYAKARGDTKYDPYTIPPRLNDNLKNGYAKLYPWSEDPAVMQRRIHEAYLAKSKIDPDLSRTLFAKNRTGARWSD